MQLVRSLKKTSCILCSAALIFSARGQETYTVTAKKPIAPISPSMWGLFFEDINRAADGGLYGEMVKNRSFDFPRPMTGWQLSPARLRDGIFVVQDQSGTNASDPKYLSVSLNARDTAAIVNHGFGGMCFRKDHDFNEGGYILTLRYRSPATGIHGRLILSDPQNKTISWVKMDMPASPNWRDSSFVMTSYDTTTSGKLELIFEGPNRVDIDRVSLFPSDTWNRQFGLRRDLLQKLHDLHPGFLRFPGGCIVEGANLSERYEWKNTIGEPEMRKLVRNIWNDNIAERPDPDYYQSFGLGFYEYFLLCEDIGASPLPIINCGMSCQFNSAEVVPIGALAPFITDALDLIEFANGDAGTRWGAVRAGLGHPAPFNLRMLGIGNENWGPQYIDRLKVFTSAIHEKYPGIRLVNSTGYAPFQQKFSFLDSALRTMHADIIDEHFYERPEWFLKNADRYDSYDRNGPKILVGEYAAQSDRVGSQKNVNNLYTALAEAAFMTGLERNAAVVSMASYAPLFAHVTGWQWTPDLIWFDNAQSYCTPNYYVQQMFSLNKGTDLVAIQFDGRAIAGEDSIWASAVIDKNSHELVIKLVNPSSLSKQKNISVMDARYEGTAVVTALQDNDASVCNSLARPFTVMPVRSLSRPKKNKMAIDLKPFSLTVIRLKIK